MKHIDGVERQYSRRHTPLLHDAPFLERRMQSPKGSVIVDITTVTLLSLQNRKYISKKMHYRRANFLKQK